MITAAAFQIAPTPSLAALDGLFVQRSVLASGCFEGETKIRKRKRDAAASFHEAGNFHERENFIQLITNQRAEIHRTVAIGIVKNASPGRAVEERTARNR